MNFFGRQIYGFKLSVLLTPPFKFSCILFRSNNFKDENVLRLKIRSSEKLIIIFYQSSAENRLKPWNSSIKITALEKSFIDLKTGQNDSALEKKRSIVWMKKSKPKCLLMRFYIKLSHLIRYTTMSRAYNNIKHRRWMIENPFHYLYIFLCGSF